MGFAQVRVDLPENATFYNHFVGGPFAPVPALVGLFPGLEYDSYITLPTPPLTPYYYNLYPPPAAGGQSPALVGVGRVFGVEWISASHAAVPTNGSFEIARFTVLLDGPAATNGIAIFPTAFVQSINNTGLPTTPLPVPPGGYILAIPEPIGAFAGALAAFVAASLRRARREVRVTG
jgi:hypothetical protein